MAWKKLSPFVPRISLVHRHCIEVIMGQFERLFKGVLYSMIGPNLLGTTVAV